MEQVLIKKERFANVDHIKFIAEIDNEINIYICNIQLFNINFNLLMLNQHFYYFTLLIMFSIFYSKKISLKTCIKKQPIYFSLKDALSFRNDGIITQRLM